MALDPSKALGHLPDGLRDELVAEFAKIARNYRERRWEAAELNGGKLCEVTYTILHGHLQGDRYADRASKPPKFDQACDSLAQLGKGTYSESARLTIPRVLKALYELRNNRGVGHVGGAVDANHMDATFVLHAAQWVMAELVRLFHDLDVAEAQTAVDALIDRTLPTLWRVRDVTRVLTIGLSLDDQTLLLLYAEPHGVHEKELARNLERDRLDNYRKVLRRLHGRRQIEYNAETREAIISPLGINDVEIRLLPLYG